MAIKSLELIDKEFPAFTARVKEKLVEGANNYGDASLDLTPTSLLKEVKDELADVMGWSFLLWCKVRDLEKRWQDPPPPVE